MARISEHGNPSNYCIVKPLKKIKKKGLWIAFGTNVRREVQYKDGELLNAKNEPYDKAGVKRSKDGTFKIKNNYLSSVVAALDKIALAEQEIGTNVVKTLQESKYKVIIVNSTMPQFDPRGEEKDANKVNDSSYLQGIKMGRGQIYGSAPSKNKGSGGELNWSPLCIEMIKNTKTKQKIEANKAMILAHELFHGYEASTGDLIFKHYKGTEIKEIRASYFANLLRTTKTFNLNYYRTEYNEKGYWLLDKEGNPRTVSRTILWD